MAGTLIRPGSIGYVSFEYTSFLTPVVHMLAYAYITAYMYRCGNALVAYKHIYTYEHAYDSKRYSLASYLQNTINIWYNNDKVNLPKQ